MLSKTVRRMMLNSRISALEEVVTLLARQGERLKKQLNAQAQLIENLVSTINQHNADDAAWQGQVNAKFAVLEAKSASDDADASDIVQAVADLKAAVANKPVLSLPADMSAGQTMLTTPVDPLPVVPPAETPPAIVPVFPNAPPVTDTPPSTVPVVPPLVPPTTVDGQAAGTSDAAAVAPVDPVSTPPAPEGDNSVGFPLSNAPQTTPAEVVPTDQLVDTPQE